MARTKGLGARSPRVRRAPYSHDKNRQRTTRTFRVDASTWYDARNRAEHEEGLTISAVVAQLVEGYAAGRVDIPRSTTVYLDDSTR